jgi:SAM-dependent methyltransferase
VNPVEYERLAAIERDHWYYEGKRAIVRYWIHRYYPLGPDSVLVDCGAGTGRFVQEMQGQGQAWAVDDHRESLEIARQVCGPDRVREGTCQQLPFPAESVDVVTALDVLEHTKNDAAALEEMQRILKPGGLLVITVPAMMCLWSDWDKALQHFRRYSAEGLTALLEGRKGEILHLAYTNVWAFPLVFLARKLRRPDSTGPRAEDRKLPGWINALLRWAFVSLACQKFWRFPFGVSLLAVVRKPGR